MSVPLVRLAALDLLRGFVAVGRRMSITAAAQDLCLTQSAVSRQIRGLEDLLGVKLLVRGHRSIAFTAEGERLFRTADSAVQQLQDVLGTIGAASAQQPVTITCSVGVAGLWVLPRLNEFLQTHPDIDVRLSANNRVGDLRQEGIDLAIRYCAAEGAPEGAVRLFGESIRPVAHPSLGITRIGNKTELKKLVLLEFDGPYRPWLRWSDWLAHQGWGEVKPKSIVRFNQYDQVIHAAIAGQGVALGRLGLIDPMLSDGRLAAVAAPKEEMPNNYAYWLVQADPLPRREVVLVAEWISAQARSMA